MSSLDEKQPLMSASMRAFLMRRLAELVGFIVLSFGSVLGIIWLRLIRTTPPLIPRLVRR
jgi:hypothetical protein